MPNSFKVENRPLKIREGKCFADLVGVEYDFISARLLCEQLKNTFSTISCPERHVLLDALSTAAVVRYARPFGSGKREKLDKSIVPQHLLSEHEWFIDLRNKHVAHSVNAYEENSLVARIHIDDYGNESVTDVAVQQNRFLSLGICETDILIELCKSILKEVLRLKEKEQKTILAIAKSRFACAK